MPWFDCATRRPINANTGGTISNNLGLILHHAVMDGSGWNLFNNPATQASAHFWIFKNGAIEQYVDSSVVAWHGKSLNTNYCGVETEGCATSPHAENMTPPMVDALARLYAEGNRRHGWQNALINQQGQRGFGYHRMAVQTACPCDVRLNRRQEILDKAFGTPVEPEPEPEPEEDDEMGLIICAAHGDGKQYLTDLATFKRPIANSDDWNSTVWSIIASGTKLYYKDINDPVRVAKESLASLPETTA